LSLFCKEGEREILFYCHPHPAPYHQGGFVSKVLINVTLSEAKGLGVVGLRRAIPILTPRFFVASLLRMTFDTKSIKGEENNNSI
jgi:hypothetical protein